MSNLNSLLDQDNHKFDPNSQTQLYQQEDSFDYLQLEGNEQEELEARKILTKRKRRVGKIEDINIDIDALFASKKRFKPDDSTSDTVTVNMKLNGAVGASNPEQ